jgi:hypothetical protein
MDKPLVVSAGQQAISCFEIASDVDQEWEFTALAQPGNYQVTGVVASVFWVDDDPERSLVSVQVGPCEFSFLSNEIGSELELEYGMWVSFVVEGLTWWWFDASFGEENPF